MYIVNIYIRNNNKYTFYCYPVRLGWKNNTDETYSCPRGWRLSAIMCAQLSTPPETPRTITGLSY